MTETRFTWRWLLVIALVGIFMGLSIGLIAGWIVFPNIGGSNVAGLSTSAQSDYIVLVANTYAYDQDLARAKQRLNLLQDKDIKTRIERLAKSLAARKDTSSANVADLAVALGSADSSLMVMAQGVGSDTADNSSEEPTKIARSDAGDNVQPTEAPQPTDASAQEPTAKPTKQKKKPTDVPTAEPKPTEAAPAEPTAVPATKAPAPTEAPTAAPSSAGAPPEWAPEYPAQWWDGVQYVPANVAPGQQYWRLKSALYCDVLDKRNNCESLPGGGMDHSIYVAVVNEDGSCADATVKHQTNTGDTTPLELKDAPYPWSTCNKDYEWNMYGEGNDVWIDGLPSDRLNGMCLCNKTPPPGGGILQGHAHVRYFLIFQKTTR